MKAAVLRQVGQPLVIEDVTINKPGPHEVLIRTVAAGVCHSDLHFIEGSYPAPVPVILGHESAGIVEQVGSEVRTVAPGDHVITCLSAFCGHCEHCLTGHMSRCQSPETRREAGEEPRLSSGTGPMNQFLNLSSFAEQMLIHQHACVKVRKDMPLDQRRLDRLLGHDRCRRGDPDVSGASRRNGRRHRLRRRRPCRDQRRCHRRRGRASSPSSMNGTKLNLAKHFGATDVVNAKDGDPVGAGSGDTTKEAACIIPSRPSASRPRPSRPSACWRAAARPT